jgi:plasmid stabilization system protein ParE
MTYRDASFNRLAIKDYREARDWYAERSEETAARFVEAVDAAVKQILDTPDSWSVVSGKYRRVPLDKFPHSLIYYERTEFDVIVCWKNDWPDCPLRVVELRSDIMRLPSL